MNAELHLPVMADEVIEWLAPAAGGVHVDCTLGAGGHFLRVARELSPQRLLGVDRDLEILTATASRLMIQVPGAHFLHSCFGRLPQLLPRLNFAPVNSLFVDLGVSSMQLDTPERGFSFQASGPLDMRMDRSCGLSLAQMLPAVSREELARIIRDYGEERHAWRIAGRIQQAAVTDGIQTTDQLRAIVHGALGTPRSGRIDSATRTFQALRIAVNCELDEVEKLLAGAIDLLVPGGRCAILSFHSLEDRLVKKFIRHQAADCHCPDRRGPCVCGHVPQIRDLTRRPVEARDEEVQSNPRSRSARLRVFERIA